MFESRQEAGKLLVLKLKKIVKKDFIVVPLLRGGIVLGKEISDYFNLPLKPLAIKKLGAPLNPELGIGAVAFDKTYYFNEDIVKNLDIMEDYKKNILKTKYREAEELQEKVEKNKKKISCVGKNIIVVDDGVAIGNTVICASLYLKKQKAGKIILAVPVISKEGINSIKNYFDRVVSLKVSSNFGSISEFYKSFPQVTDKEVLNFLL